MVTMPPLPANGQPDTQPLVGAELPARWFETTAGLALLDSEYPAIVEALDERPGQPWLWLGPVAPAAGLEGHGLHLTPAGGDWSGSVRCGATWPLASESVTCIVAQHVIGDRRRSAAVLDECARVLLPGGRLWLFALNPLAPYRWRWRGHGLSASEPLTWRRRLRAAGLSPDPVSKGIGPTWQVGQAAQLQDGPGLRAAYLIRAEKRALPLTPIRQRRPLRLAGGLPAG